MNSNTYKPINCDLHSYIEDFIVKKTAVDLCFLDGNETISQTGVVLLDVWTNKGEEFLKTDKNQSIRLDKIISINDLVFNTKTCKTS